MMVPSSSLLSLMCSRNQEEEHELFRKVKIVKMRKSQTQKQTNKQTITGIKCEPTNKQKWQFLKLELYFENTKLEEEKYSHYYNSQQKKTPIN